jgi:uncharacterized membrane protein YidH (DUF202 family)
VSNTSLAWRRVAIGLVSAAVVVALFSAGLLHAPSAGIDGFVVNRASDLAVLLPLARAANFSISLQAAGDESQVREF